MGTNNSQAKDISINFQGDAHRERVRLVWWESDCITREKERRLCLIHWSADEPKTHYIAFDCLGTYSFRKNFFQIDGIIPDGLMPAMNISEQKRLADTLRIKLESQTGYEVSKIPTGLIDWEGVVTYK